MSASEVKVSLLDQYLTLSPQKKGLLEFGFLGICIIATFFVDLNFGLNLSSKFCWWSAGAGVFFILAGLLVHRWAEIAHKHAHDHSSEIESVVTSGLYGRIRHPIYVGVILMVFGMGIVRISVVTLLVSGLVILSWVGTAFAEERYLVQVHPEYKEFQKQVRFMFIPGVF